MDNSKRFKYPKEISQFGGNMYRKKVLNLLLSFVLTGLLVLSSIIKVNLGDYTSLVRWLFILALLIVNISLLGVSKNKNWGIFDWLELTTFIVVNIFLIYLIIGKAGFWFRMSVFILILATLLSPERGEKPEKIKEIKKEAKILESAEEKIKKYARNNKEAVNKNKEEKKNKKYFASKKGKVFHRRGCKVGNRISKRNRVYFSTQEEAIKQGYKPCRVCIK